MICNLQILIYLLSWHSLLTLQNVLYCQLIKLVEGELCDSHMSVIHKSGSSFTTGKPDEFTQKLSRLMSTAGSNKRKLFQQKEPFLIRF